MITSWGQFLGLLFWNELSSYIFTIPYCHFIHIGVEKCSLSDFLIFSYKSTAETEYNIDQTQTSYITGTIEIITCTFGQEFFFFGISSICIPAELMALVDNARIHIFIIFEQRLTCLTVVLDFIGI